MKPRDAAGAALQLSHRYDPSLQRYRFSKVVVVSPAASLTVSAAVGARSSGWTKSRYGTDVRSSSVHPSVSCQAAFTRLKRPSIPAIHIMSGVREKN